MEFVPINYKCYNCGKQLAAKWAGGLNNQRGIDLSHADTGNRLCDIPAPKAVAYSLSGAAKELEKALSTVTSRGQNPQPQDTIHLSPAKSD